MPRPALYQPDIPQNTGTMLRLAACLASPVESSSRRASTSPTAISAAPARHLDRVEITRHPSWRAFRGLAAAAGPPRSRDHEAASPYADFAFKRDDVSCSAANRPASPTRCMRRRTPASTCPCGRARARSTSPSRRDDPRRGAARRLGAFLVLSWTPQLEGWAGLIIMRAVVVTPWGRWRLGSGEPSRRIPRLCGRGPRAAAGAAAGRGRSSSSFAASSGGTEDVRRGSPDVHQLAAGP